MYVSRLLYLFICWWTFRLLPCPSYCYWYCNEHWDAYILWTIFSSGYMPSEPNLHQYLYCVSYSTWYSSMYNRNVWSEVKSFSRVRLFATPWTVAHQAPPSLGFSRQEYWSGLPFPSPGDLPNPGIDPNLLYCRQTLYHLSHQGTIVCTTGMRDVSFNVEKNMIFCER